MLNDQRPDLKLFPTKCLPDVLRDMVNAVSRFTCTDPAMCATALISALSYTLTGVYRIEGKKGHTEPPVIYGLNIAEPSAKKSPVIAIIRKPFYDYSERYNSENKHNVLAAVTKKSLLSKQIKALESAEKADPKKILSLRLELSNVRGDTPKRMVVDDVTPEALLLLMKENSTLLMLSDEAGMLSNFSGRYSNNIPNLDLLLKAWNGEAFTSDRASRESVSIAKPYLSVCLACQPYVFRNMIGNNAFRGSGLIARFIYCFASEYQGQEIYDTDPVPDEVMKRYESLVTKLLEAKTAHSTAEKMLHFDAETYGLFCEYHDKYIVPEYGKKFAFCKDWAGKYHGLILRLCLIMHCIECVQKGIDPESVPVGATALSYAVPLGEYYADQAIYAYSQAEADPQGDNAAYLIRYLVSKKIAKIKARDLFQNCRSRRFPSMRELNETIDILEEKGLVRRTEEIISNNKSVIILVNPDIL